jgi:hypothetical protein
MRKRIAAQSDSSSRVVEPGRSIVPVEVDQAVLRQLISVYGDETLTGEAVAKANREAEKRRPEFAQHLASLGAETRLITPAVCAVSERVERATRSNPLRPRGHWRATGARRVP